MMNDGDTTAHRLLSSGIVVVVAAAANFDDFRDVTNVSKLM